MLNIVIILFVLIESANVCVLYFKPSTWLGNGVGVFNGFHRAQENAENKQFTKYLINWIANAKAIFIALLLIVLFTGSEEIKLYSCFAMVASIALYFVSLHPIIKKLDAQGEITPKGYSKILAGMIAGFMAMFVIGITLHFVGF